MLQHFRSIIPVIAIAFVAVLFVFGGSEVSAEDDTANTLKVSPLRTDITINTGESKILEITVTNPTSSDILIHPMSNDFVAGDDNGTPALILDENEYAQSHSLKRFIGDMSDFTVPANNSVTMEIKISVPTDADSGGYFGAIRLAPTTADSGGQVNMSASVASLVLLTVPGDLSEKLTLDKFDIQQDDISRTTFRTSNDLELEFNFQNTGNVQAGPFGKISVLHGDEVVYSVDFNDKDQRDTVLPDSSRTWTVPLENIGTFGKYTVQATFTYGEKNQTIEATRSFWVIPTWVIVAAIVGLVLLVGAIVLAVWLIVRHRKNNGPKGLMRGRHGHYRR